MLASTLKEELAKESESALFQLKQLLDQEENASNDKSNEDLPREKSIVVRVVYLFFYSKCSLQILF